MLSWALVTAFCGFVKNFAGLVVCRIMLGFCESALFPSLNLYISMFWKREELAKRSAQLFVAMALAGAFGGLLAYGLVQIHASEEGWGKEGWRWLFWVEGMISFVIGVFAYWLYPDGPETAYFLTEEERDIGRRRLVRHGNYEPYAFSDVRAALTSPICYLSGLLQLCCDTYLYSVTTFLPVIVRGMGFTSLQAQYLTIPIYVAAAIGIFFMAFLSDRLQRRAPIMLIFSLFTVAGYSILLGNHTPAVNYFACYLVLFGGYVFGLNVTWINGNTSPHYKRATAIAMNQTLGNLGGVVAGQIYLSSEKPYYTTGHSVALAGCCLSWFVTIVMWIMFKRRNERKERMVAEGVEDKWSGDDSIHFKYLL